MPLGYLHVGDKAPLLENESVEHLVVVAMTSPELKSGGPWLFTPQVPSRDAASALLGGAVLLINARTVAHSSGHSRTQQDITLKLQWLWCTRDAP